MKFLKELIQYEKYKKYFNLNSGFSLNKNDFFYLIAGMLFWLFYLLSYNDLLNGLLIGFMVFISLKIINLLLPKIKFSKKARLIEKELPFALMSLAVQLNMNVSFEKAIENISKDNFGPFSYELKKVLVEVREKGSGLNEAFFNLSERIDSIELRRSLSQISNVYLHGGKRQGEPIKRIAKEQLMKQKNVLREFSGKLSVFSLVFIAVSAIMPALFQSFVIIGSMFLKLNITSLDILILTSVIFPVADISILALIQAKSPVFS